MSVVNCKVKFIRPAYQNLKEWCEDENNIYIGRAGIVFVKNENGELERYPKKHSNFANPFKIGSDGSRKEVIDKYKKYIIKKLREDRKLLAEFISLKGKNLGCWCHPEPCHGDVLLELLRSIEDD